MPFLASYDLGATLEQHCIVEELSDCEIEIALSNFNQMKENNSLFGEFDSDTWMITNETNSFNLNFQFNEIAIEIQTKTTYDEFVNQVKYYICLCFGKNTMTILPRVLHSIKKAVNGTNCFTIMPKEIEFLQDYGVGEFLSLISWVDEAFIFQPLIHTYDHYRRRNLAEYQSYFLFNDIIKAFWVTATDMEKTLYYPIFLWWNISMVIPLRVTEFSVIPKDCLSRKGECFYLTIRRTKLKGNVDINKRYKLDTDYKKFTYEITSEMAESIEDYKRRIAEFAPAEIDSLFSDTVFQESRKKLYPTKKKQIVYSHMRVQHFMMLLELFYKYIIADKYQYRILSREQGQQTNSIGEKAILGQKEIIQLQLGDTRHIALQNLLLNGCNLLMVREISGHETVNEIFHYSGNMKNLIKCRAYNLYQLSKNNDGVNTLVYHSPKNISGAELIKNKTTTAKCIAVDDGLCYSTKFVELNDSSDCYAVGGDCSVCIYCKKTRSAFTTCQQREHDFQEKITKMKIWLCSLKQIKDVEEMIITAERMASASKNLEMVYLEMLEEGISDF